MVEQSVKKRKPPTFVHLPPEIAKKRKREWVDEKKLKSKWRKERLRDGLIKKPAVEEQQDNVSTDGEENEEESEEESESDSDTRSVSPKHVEEDNTRETDTPPPPRKKRRLGQVKEHQKGAAKPKPDSLPTNGDEDEAEPSLRELQKKAYSKESLHAFKSDPLHRRRGRGRGSSQLPQRGGRGGQTSSSRGRGSVRGNGGGGRGGARRGQPDMRLRMNSLVEQIKRSAGAG